MGDEGRKPRDLKERTGDFALRVIRLDVALPKKSESQVPRPVRFDTVQVTFDTDVNRRVTLQLFRYPDCLKSFLHGGGCRNGVEPVARKLLSAPRAHLSTGSIRQVRIHVRETNGAASARIYEVRIYDSVSA